nr:hypothetical protein Iba_chr15aCG15640 [Ipomoea batatas]
MWNPIRRFSSPNPVRTSGEAVHQFPSPERPPVTEASRDRLRLWMRRSLIISHSLKRAVVIVRRRHLLLRGAGSGSNASALPSFCARKWWLGLGRWLPSTGYKEKKPDHVNHDWLENRTKMFFDFYKQLPSSLLRLIKLSLKRIKGENGNVVNTTIRNTSEDYMMVQTSDNRTDRGTTCNTNYKQLTGSENSTYIGTITGTPKNRFNVTLGSKNSLPLSDITNCNGTIRSKKIKGSLTLTGVSTIDNNVNAHKRSERSQSYSLGISRPNITQESDPQPQVVICRDLSQDFDEVMETEVQSGN